MTRKREILIDAIQFIFVMYPGEFEETLILPKAVCKELESVIARRATLKRGRLLVHVSITMNVEKGYYQFDQGWTDFLASHKIIVSHALLLFKHTGNMNFDVAVFDASGVEVHGKENTEVNTAKKILDQHTRDTDLDCPPFFELTVTENTRYAVVSFMTNFSASNFVRLLTFTSSLKFVSEMRRVSNGLSQCGGMIPVQRNTG